MSFEAIQQEITTWDAENLRKLQALVVSLRLRQDEPGFAEKMARKIDDQTPGNWVTLEEFALKQAVILNEVSPRAKAGGETQ